MDFGAGGSRLGATPVGLVRTNGIRPTVTRDEDRRIGLSSGQTQADDSVRLPVGSQRHRGSVAGGQGR
jgi:hypothetical protein